MSDESQISGNEQVFWHLIEIGIALSSEHDTTKLMESILKEAQDITRADGGTLYLLRDRDHTQARLEFNIVRNDSLHVHWVRSLDATEADIYPSLPLRDSLGQAEHHNVATHVAWTRQLSNIPDVYEVTDFDFSGARRFDEKNGYRTRSLLTIPLCNHDQETIGVLQLINARDETGQVMAFPESQETIVRALASLAAVALDNRILFEQHKALLKSFTDTIADAIDAKSPYTSAHCRRVPIITDMLAQAACEEQEGPLADFTLDTDDWYELRVASGMHDCGKLVTPDYLLDKSTKLHRMRDGMDVIDVRVVVMMREAEIDYLRALQAQPQHADVLLADLEAKITQLREAQDFLHESNRGGEFFSDQARQRLLELAAWRWKDAQGHEQTLLTEEDVAYLGIQRGTLSAEERERINEHMVVTIKMLNSLPFPKSLHRVPEYAGGHHERMDGSGFPQGLTREQMSWPARMMAIADIFEALTASDRPYKPPMKLSESLRIMQRMRDQHHIDPDLYQLFLRRRVWENYAHTVNLSREQLDVEDISPFL
ncbi:MAG: GAF domain-containing protein [Pseudomonadales bacterium]|nr:GAF domain-containing protein [Pseudomonadales bacterium]